MDKNYFSFHKPYIHKVLDSEVLSEDSPGQVISPAGAVDEGKIVCSLTAQVTGTERGVLLAAFGAIPGAIVGPLSHRGLFQRLLVKVHCQVEQP